MGAGIRRRIDILPAVAHRVRHLYRLGHWKLRIAPRGSTVKRIKAWKAQRALSQLKFADHPRVSVIVQSFNQVRNIKLLEARLRLTCADELIVCEDGSLDGSLEEWVRRLTRPNDFLIRSNDIHEIRAYSRAIDHARGEFICLMQDDDRPPRDGSWLAKALEVFMHYPKLAILGCWCGFNQYFAEEYNAPWLPDGLRRIPFYDPNTRLPFIFVENVNIGPYLLRKSTYRELGGFDLRFSAPGEPGITFEAELCYRAWRRGYEVALTNIPVKMERGKCEYVFPGGTSLWGNAERLENEAVNKRRIVELYDRHLPSIQERVNGLNAELSRVNG
jgi:glycosyltransferase involved in cell wall biosynthesis